MRFWNLLHYRLVQKKGTVLPSTCLAWPVVAGCSRAETFSPLSAISFAQPCSQKDPILSLKVHHSLSRCSVRQFHGRAFRCLLMQIGSAAFFMANNCMHFTRRDHDVVFHSFPPKKTTAVSSFYNAVLSCERILLITWKLELQFTIFAIQGRATWK